MNNYFEFKYHERCVGIMAVGRMNIIDKDDLEVPEDFVFYFKNNTCQPEDSFNKATSALLNLTGFLYNRDKGKCDYCGADLHGACQVIFKKGYDQEDWNGGCLLCIDCTNLMDISEAISMDMEKERI